jgi:uncharacterized protein involved in type VI secretion and phage assembly
VGRDNGIVIALVTDLDDPEGLGRVRVRYPHLDDQLSNWARLVAPMAGKNRGVFLRPDVDDEVLVAFELGDPRRPYVLGSLWSKVDTPPPDDGQPTRNNWRFVTSRSGHVLRFDDTAGAEKVEIVDKAGTHRLVLDAAGDRIQITCDAGDLEITAPAGKASISAQQIEIKATADLTVQAGGQLTIKGATVNINP